MARRILFVLSWYATHADATAGSFFREQAVTLARAGHDVAMLSPRVWGPRDLRRGAIPWLFRTRREQDDGVRIYRRNTIHLLPRMPGRDCFAFVRSGRRCLNAYLEDGAPPDIVHAQGCLYGGLLAREISRRLSVPYVITEHSANFVKGRVRPWQRRLAAGAFRDAAARIAVGTPLAVALVAQYEDAVLPVRRIPNVLPFQFEEATPRPLPPAPPFVFLNVARFVREKNHDGLLRAFAAAFASAPDVTLRLVGGGPEYDAIRALAARLGIAGRVSFAGALPREDVERELRRAHAFVLPSHVETFGVAAIEALACGVPLVATGCGGPQDIVTPGNGILVPPGDEAALAGALVRMRKEAAGYDPDVLRADCVARYGRKAFLERIETVYDEVLRMAGKNIAPAAERRPGRRDGKDR